MKANFAVFLILAMFAPVYCTGATKDELESMWDAQRTALQSVVIRCRTVRRQTPETTNLGRDEVRKLLEAKDLSVDEGALKDVAHRLDPTLSGVERAWTDGEIIFDVDSVRKDITFEGITRSHVWHRDLQLIKEPRNKQVKMTLRANSSIEIPEIEDFVYMPPQGATKRLTVEAKDGGRLILSIGNRMIDVDSDTGFVREYRLGDYETGKKYWEVLQFGITTYGPVAAPAWRFDGEYVRKRLHSFTLRVLDEIDLGGVTDAEFAVSAEPGSVVVDRRGERKIRRIKEPSVDVSTIELDQATDTE